jgi:hypothetical protein
MVTATYYRYVKKVLWIRIQLNDLHNVEYYGSESETKFISWYRYRYLTTDEKNLLQMELIF